MSNTKRWYCSRCLTSFAQNPLECPNLSCQIERPERGWGVIHEPGDIFDRRFYIHSCLAIGGSGIAYLAKELDDNDQQKEPFVAVKVLFVLRSSGTYLRRLATEAQILESLEHPNIIQYRGFAHFSGQSPYLITLFAQGGSLLDHLKRHGPLTMRAAAEVGRQICWALECAHEKGVIHRDLKPENILLAQKTDPEGPFSIRVADFGIAKVQSSLASHLTRTGAFMGTPHYAAPEQFTGSNVDVASDVFSVVVMLYHCMTGHHLVPIAAALHSFSTEEIDELFRSRLPLTFEDGQGTPEESQLFQQLFVEALLMEPQKRCTMARVLEIFEAVLGNIELSQTATTQLQDKRKQEPPVSDDTETVPLEYPKKPSVLSCRSQLRHQVLRHCHNQQSLVPMGCCLHCQSGLYSSHPSQKQHFHRST